MTKLSEEIIAAITAALEATIKGTSKKIIVKSIKRVPETSPTWVTAGKLERMRRRINS